MLGINFARITKYKVDFITLALERKGKRKRNEQGTGSSSYVIYRFLYNLSMIKLAGDLKQN